MKTSIENQNYSLEQARKVEKWLDGDQVVIPELMVVSCGGVMSIAAIDCALKSLRRVGIPFAMVAVCGSDFPNYFANWPTFKSSTQVAVEPGEPATAVVGVEGKFEFLGFRNWLTIKQTSESWVEIKPEDETIHLELFDVGINYLKTDKVEKSLFFLAENGAC